MEDVLFGAVTLFCREDSEIPKEYLDHKQQQQPQTNVLAIPTAVSLVLARFLKVKSLSHPNLCTYLDLQPCRTAQNAVFFVSEHFSTSLSTTFTFLTTSDKQQVAIQLAKAVDYCHRNFVTIGNISLDDILLSNSNPLTIKLARFGLYHVGYGCVNHVIGSVYYMAPERLATLQQDAYASFCSDIWACGIALLELFMNLRLSELWGVKQAAIVMQGLIRKANKTSIYSHLLERIKSIHLNPSNLIELPSDLVQVISNCLEVLPSKRTKNLIYDLERLFGDVNGNIVDEIDTIKSRLINPSLVPGQFPSRPIQEKYYLWNLCGADLSSILISKGMIRMNAPVRSIPTMVLDDFHQFGNEKMRKVEVNTNVVVLPCKNLNTRLHQLNRTLYRDSLEIEHNKQGTLQHQNLNVKERNIDYQSIRMCQIKRYLNAYPFKSDQLYSELSKDVPPVYRNLCWAVLLVVYQNEADSVFESIDSVTEQQSDRQLQVDIPRCHQYDIIMATPAAHEKLKIILKAWLTKETGYVYWQGLDSLAAPFLYLNFNNLPLAFACFQKFIKRYLHNFFIQDNSVVIKEYLSVFMQLLAFLDAPLFQHLLDLDFQPELFAISWFLTCFAHVLPLHKIFHLWDSLLLADSSFPLFVGVAILTHFRVPLMNAQFNDAILLFSDLPDIPIDEIVTIAWKYYNFAPVGCAYRRNSSAHRRRNEGYGENVHFETPSWTTCPSPYLYNHDLRQLILQNQVLMIDLRSDFLHNRLSIPGSICCAFELNGYINDEFMRTVGNAVELAIKNQHIICLIDIQPYSNAIKACYDLIRSYNNYICIYADDIATLNTNN